MPTLFEDHDMWRDVYIEMDTEELLETFGRNVERLTVADEVDSRQVVTASLDVLHEYITGRVLASDDVLALSVMLRKAEEAGWHLD